MSTHEVLEHQEHAEHAAGHGSKKAALLIAALAALLAICEQQAKHAEIAVQENAVLTADAWAQYQAKSIRATLAQDIAGLGATLDRPVQPDQIAMREGLIKQLQSDQVRYEKDAKDGKEAIAERAHVFDEVRQDARERTHTYDNAAAALQLGIVLATASVITMSKMLLRFAYALGGVGLVLAILGAVAPSLGTL
ncbi:MAG TPA: DUF4337 family protein [Acetobacteraceae bacterium]|nr:DUF4337 family protein [Acetobacteraceae bacterium]